MTKLPTEEFQGFGSDLVPGFDIAISGIDASGGTDLYQLVRPFCVGVTFEDDEEMSSLLELQLVNQADTAPGVPVNWNALIDSKLLAEGNTVDLWMGYGSSRVFMDRLVLTNWNPTFPEQEPGTLTVKGFDGREALAGHQFRIIRRHAFEAAAGSSKTKKKRSKKGKKKSSGKRTVAYRNLSDDQIVKKIADKYGFGTDADQCENARHTTKVTDAKTGKAKTVTVYPTRVHAVDVSDWKFLRRLAGINNFDLWVDYSQEQERYVVHFKKREDATTAGYRFEYKPDGSGTLLSAEPEFEIHDQATDIEVLYYDSRKRAVERTVVSETAGGEDMHLDAARVAPGQLQAKKELSAGARVRFQALGQMLELFSDKPFRSRNEAAKFVQEYMKKRERDFLIIQGRVVGLPKLRSRQTHELAGLGKRLDGLYRFTNVKHKMHPGSIYVCEFTAHKIVSNMVVRRAESSEAKRADVDVQGTE